MTTKEILTQARVLVKQSWTQGAYARNSDGESVAAKDPTACSWCAVGAIKAANPDGYPRLCELWDLFDNLVGRPLTISFNDASDTTQEDVLSLYDRVIARCENDD